MSSGKTFRPAGDSDDDDEFGDDWTNGGGNGDNGDGGKAGELKNGAKEEKADDWRANVFGEGYKKPADPSPFESLELEFRVAIQ